MKNWLDNLEQYRSPIQKFEKHPWKGPWYSDDGEDGVLNYIFEHINDEANFAVDIGAAHGYGGSHVRYLADKYDWGSAEMDGSRKWKPIHPRVHREWITPDNICDLLKKYNTPKEFSLLSLDIDSMDYYVLEKLLSGNYRPNVAIIEFNPIFSYNEAYVKKYNAKFRKDGTSNYGASLRAFEILFNNVEYTLVHTFENLESRKKNNAIFIKNKFIADNIKISSIKDFHPTPWIENHKRKNNRNFGNTLDKIKTNLINNEFIAIT